MCTLDKNIHLKFSNRKKLTITMNDFQPSPLHPPKPSLEILNELLFKCLGISLLYPLLLFFFFLNFILFYDLYSLFSIWRSLLAAVSLPGLISFPTYWYPLVLCSIQSCSICTYNTGFCVCIRCFPIICQCFLFLPRYFKFCFMA